MASLLLLDEQRLVSLPARCEIGRRPGNALRLPRPEVSGVHAALRWTGAAWELKDLASRNGTWVNGARLAPGGWVALAEGDLLAFGHPDLALRLADGGPPGLSALPEDGGPPLEAVGDLLWLPDPERPLAQVSHSPERGWLLDRDGLREEVQDQALVEVGGRRFRLHLPRAAESTLRLQPDTPTLGELRFRFRVSRDEEHCALQVQRGAQVDDLGARAHTYTLLTLARLRLADAALPPAAQGWVERERLLRMLRCAEGKVNLHIYRGRQQLAALGVVDADALVERRLDAGQLRFGSDAVEVEVI